ncbi:hypothetical protein Tco_0729909 [Tanacetum coccineum]|uniref:Uncharacterized protein n=1 Tax=Tanacetum coccineum TaxID=301880 RepID=A0ABQ4YTD0_9ASTR
MQSKHVQIQTDAGSDRSRQVHSTELHKYRDEREADRHTADSDNNDSDNRFRQTTVSDRHQYIRHTVTTDSTADRQTYSMQNEAKPDNTKQM